MDSIKVRSCSNSLYMIFIDFPQKKIGFPASPNMIPDYPRRLSFSFPSSTTLAVLKATGKEGLDDLNHGIPKPLKSQTPRKKRSFPKKVELLEISYFQDCAKYTTYHQNAVNILD